MKRATGLTSILYLLSSVLASSLLSGCQLIGAGAQMLPPPVIQAQYKKLAGERVGVMCWADRGMRIEWEFLQLDLANSIQAKLQDTAAPKDKNKDRKPGEPPKAAVKELQGTTFPIVPRSIVRFQQDNPEIDGQAIGEVAPRIGGITRLIYVEVEDFATRPDGGVELFRGDAKCTLRVVEIDPANHTAKVAYEENDVTASFPPKSPKEGRPSLGDRRIYVGLIDALAAEIAKRFVPYEEEQ
jgi:hypothetical protein